jgi:phage baseplate assembly protein W
MANRLYNQRRVAVNRATTGDANTGSFTYKGFSSQESKKRFKIYDIELVKRDLINHFHIKKGEKLENPNFGTVIWDMLFEPMTEENKKIINSDVEAIVNYDPRIAITAVTVDSTQQGIRIEVDCVYMPFNINERMTFDFDKENNIIR